MLIKVSFRPFRRRLLETRLEGGGDNHLYTYMGEFCSEFQTSKMQNL